MLAVREWFQSLTLSEIVDWVSILGFALTLWVAFSVWRIKSFYLVTARVPALARRLRQHSSSLATCLNDLENFADKAREELVAAEVTANSLRRKLSGTPKRTTRTLVRTIQQARLPEMDATRVRAAYLQMIHVSEELKDLLSDLKWEK